MVAKQSLYLVLDLPNVAQDAVDFFVVLGWVGEDIALHKEVRSHCFWGMVVNDGVDMVVWEKCANDRVAWESSTNKWISICCEQQSSMIPQPSENWQLDEGACACFLVGTRLAEGCVRTFWKYAFCTIWIWVRSFSPSSLLQAPFQMPMQTEASHLQQQVKQVSKSKNKNAVGKTYHSCEATTSTDDLYDGHGSTDSHHHSPLQSKRNPWRKKWAMERLS